MFDETETVSQRKRWGNLKTYFLKLDCSEKGGKRGGGGKEREVKTLANNVIITLNFLTIWKIELIN